jgi:hypothetical protein
VRSGAIRLEDLDPPSHVPASVWEGEAQPYVPSRYVVCAGWSQEAMRLLPQRTQDLLLGHMDKLAVYNGEALFSRLGRGVACPEMTIEEARALDKIFLEVGFERSETASGLVYDIKARDVSSIHVIPYYRAECSSAPAAQGERRGFDRPLTDTQPSVRHSTEAAVPRARAVHPAVASADGFRACATQPS